MNLGPESAVGNVPHLGFWVWVRTTISTLWLCGMGALLWVAWVPVECCCTSKRRKSNSSVKDKVVPGLRAASPRLTQAKSSSSPPIISAVRVFGLVSVEAPDNVTNVPPSQPTRAHVSNVSLSPPIHAVNATVGPPVHAEAPSGHRHRPAALCHGIFSGPQHARCATGARGDELRMCLARTDANVAVTISRSTTVSALSTSRHSRSVEAVL